MTLPTASARPALAARIAAASTSHPILRRAIAPALYAEMRGLADSLDVADSWRALSKVLTDCEVELASSDMDRAMDFGELSRKANNYGVLMGVRCKRAALRAGRRVPRIIETACTEVAS
jgi:hypothetical protein